MKSYKGWSAEFRKESLKLTNRAKKTGWIDEPKKCQKCGQEKGIIHLHNEDYDITYNTLLEAFRRFPITITPLEKKQVNDALTQLCWRCHMMHHSVRRNPEAVRIYFEEVASGKQYPPVFRHNFDILKENGI